MVKKTAIHIIPNLNGRRGAYLIICMNEQAYADFLVGKDNHPVTAFSVQPKEKNEIDSLLIELHDGIAKVITTTEE